MRLFEIYEHPLIESFRKIASTIKSDTDSKYYLILPPEYNIPENLSDPLLYLYCLKRSILSRYDDAKYQFIVKQGYLYPCDEFNSSEPRFEVLQSTPCNTSYGFQFIMLEIDMNPYDPSPIPPLCFELQEGFSHPSSAMEFLHSHLRVNGLQKSLDELKRMGKAAKVSEANTEEVIEYMQGAMDNISELVFSVQLYHFIPSVFKMKINSLVFYAVVGEFHDKLMKAYQHKFSKEDKQASKIIKKANPDSNPVIGKAIESLKGLDTIKHVNEAIEKVVGFFDFLVSSLGSEASADDIVPLVCTSFLSCTFISSHLVSTFQYLADIWPQNGLDEKTTYILATCSVAAYHFATESSVFEIPSAPSKHL